eukprot:10589723-Alexandrium_andersonii.AAC.1
MPAADCGHGFSPRGHCRPEEVRQELLPSFRARGPSGGPGLEACFQQQQQLNIFSAGSPRG